MALTNASVGWHITADNFDYRTCTKEEKRSVICIISHRRNNQPPRYNTQKYSTFDALGVKDTDPIFHFLLTSIYLFCFSFCAFLTFSLAPAIFLAVAIQISHKLPTAVKEPFAKGPKGPHFMLAWHRCVFSSDFLNPNCPVIWPVRSELLYIVAYLLISFVSYQAKMATKEHIVNKYLYDFFHKYTFYKVSGSFPHPKSFFMVAITNY